MKYLFLSLVMTVVLAGCGGGGGGSGSSVDAGGAQVAVETSSAGSSASVPAPAPASASASEIPPVENVTKEVTLAWNESLNEQGKPDANVTGYKIHYGNKPGEYSAVVTVERVTSATLAGLNPGSYYFALTAFDASGNESVFSGEISATI